MVAKIAVITGSNQYQTMSPAIFIRYLELKRLVQNKKGGRDRLFLLFVLVIGAIVVGPPTVRRVVDATHFG